MKAKEPTVLEYALLGLLHQQPQSGYDLRKIFAATALGSYSSSPGTVYPALQRLEKRALITGRVDERTALRPRKVFWPTAAGSELLRLWLSRPLSQDDVARRLDELMLRFAFHAVLDDRVATKEFLRSLAGEIDAYVRELESQKDLIPKAGPVHPRLALEAGIYQYRAAARWARMALGRFEDEG